MNGEPAAIAITEGWHNRIRGCAVGVAIYDAKDQTLIYSRGWCLPDPQASRTMARLEATLSALRVSDVRPIEIRSASRWVAEQISSFGRVDSENEAAVDLIDELRSYRSEARFVCVPPEDVKIARDLALAAMDRHDGVEVHQGGVATVAARPSLESRLGRVGALARLYRLTGGIDAVVRTLVEIVPDEMNEIYDGRLPRVDSLARTAGQWSKYFNAGYEPSPKEAAA